MSSRLSPQFPPRSFITVARTPGAVERICGRVADSYAEEIDRCLRRAGHPGAHDSGERSWNDVPQVRQ